MKGPFEYDFTGKDSKAYCHKFMHLVVALKWDDDNENDNLRLHVFSFLGVQLREAVSLFSRVDPPEDYLEALKQSCQLYFNCHSLILGSVTPTAWTIGSAVPIMQSLSLIGTAWAWVWLQRREERQNISSWQHLLSMPHVP